MEADITVGIQMGNVTFSFKTDAAGAGIEPAISAIRKIVSSHRELLESFESSQFQTIVAQTPKLSEMSLESIGVPSNVLDAIKGQLRRISYWNLVLVLLHSSSDTLSYDNLMSLSKDIGKPISFDWLNTEFHRAKYKGLVRSESIPGHRERAYSLTERGRVRAEAFIARLVNPNKE